jgi:putative transposase
MSTDYPVKLLCAVLDVSRSGYHAWVKRPPSRRSEEDGRFTAQILQLHAASRGTYGSPRLQIELQEQGLRLGRRRIMRLMRHAHVQGRHRRRWRVNTTDSRHDHAIAANLLPTLRPPSRVNEVWATDITCVWTSEGWLYLAGVLDLFSRRLVGWAFGETLAATLCVTALNMAAQHRRPARGLVHHSDRGVQYASDEYRRALHRLGAIASMSRRANCYDNATMESFWSTLKGDCVETRVFTTRREAQLAIFDYIETFYNRARRHSSLGYKSPVAFEQHHN